MQGCALWGFVDMSSRLGGQIPKTPNFGAWIGMVKPNSQNKKHAYYRNQWIDSNQILHNDKEHQRLFVVGRNARKNPRWWMATILKKTINCHISVMIWPVAAKFGTVTHFEPVHPPAIKIQDFWKSKVADHRNFEYWKITNEFSDIANSYY